MASDDEPPKVPPNVVSMRLRRRQQLAEDGLSDDPVSHLARELTDLLGEQQAREVSLAHPKTAHEFAVQQLLAIEFATNALLRVLEKSLGPILFNTTLVEVDRRRHFYKVEWPEHEQSETYLDLLPNEEKKPGEVIVLKKDPDEPT